MEERQAKFINGYDHEEDKPGGLESDSCELEEQIHDEVKMMTATNNKLVAVKGNVM